MGLIGIPDFAFGLPGTLIVPAALIIGGCLVFRMLDAVFDGCSWW